MNPVKSGGGIIHKGTYAVNHRYTGVPANVDGFRCPRTFSHSLLKPNPIDTGVDTLFGDPDARLGTYRDNNALHIRRKIFDGWNTPMAVDLVGFRVDRIYLHTLRRNFPEKGVAPLPRGSGRPYQTNAFVRDKSLYRIFHDRPPTPGWNRGCEDQYTRGIRVF